MERRGRAAKRVGFTLVTVLGVLEVLARLWLAFDPTSNFHDGMIADPDPEILLRPRPSAEAEVNSLGLRGPEPRENALRRVLVLGAFRMMRTLNEAARIRAEVEATGTVPDSASWAK